MALTIVLEGQANLGVTTGSPATIVVQVGAPAVQAVWGRINGTLANQTDLKSALDAKLSVADAATEYYPLNSNPAGYLTPSTLPPLDYLPLAGGTMAAGALQIFPATNGNDSEVGAWGFGVENVNGQTAYIEPHQIRIYDSTNAAGVSLTSSAISFPDGSTQASAFIPSDYLTATEVSSTYLSQSSAAATYQPISGMSAYLTTSSAASTYLSQTDAASTYLSQSSAAATYAPIASPTFTGDPKAPTPATSDNDTSVATTAFVKAQGYLTTTSAASNYYPLNSNPAGYLTTATLPPLNYLPLSGGTVTGNINAGEYKYGTSGFGYLHNHVFGDFPVTDTLTLNGSGIAYNGNGGEQIYNLTTSGVSGLNTDDNIWGINSHGVGGRWNGTFAWGLNEEQVYGYGWSIGSSGVVGITIPLPPEATFEKVSVIKDNGTNASTAVIDLNGLDITSSYVDATDRYDASLSFGAVNGLTVGGGGSFTGSVSAGPYSQLSVGIIGGSNYARFNNDFSGGYSEIKSNGNNPTLKLTQTGYGDAFRVEDSSPDSTPFVIDRDGHVGIGATPSSTICLCVDSTGIKYGSGTTPQTVAYLPGAVAITGGSIGSAVTATTQTSTDNSTKISTTAFVKAQGYLTSSSAASTYQSISGMTAYLTTSSAASTYLSQASAASTYQPISGMSAYLTTSSAASTYLSQVSAASTYQTQSAMTDYLTTFSAAATYLSQSSAASTYQPKSEMVNYLTTSSAASIYLSQSSAASTYQTQAGMSGYLTTSSAAAIYAPLAGATFTGKVNLTQTATDSSLNIGSILYTSAPANAVNGDIWLQDTGTPPTISPKFFFKANNTAYNVATISTANVFSRNQTINATAGSSYALDVTQSGNGGGLKITNLGTGESLRVEDETSPDSTPFVVSNSGKVGIGATPDASVALTVDASGIKFSDGSIQTVAGANPASFAPLAGATFTGKVNINTSTTAAGFNIKTGVVPTTTSIGDLWIGATGIRYADSGNINRLVADTNRTNTFTSYQLFQSTETNFPSVTITANGNGGGLKITNLGTGESLRVEDETSPDATPFVISNSGRVGIGVAPDATVALSVDATGIKVNGATLIPAAAVTNAPIQSGNMSHSEYPKELIITINGVQYGIPLRVV